MYISSTYFIHCCEKINKNLKSLGTRCGRIKMEQRIKYFSHKNTLLTERGIMCIKLKFSRNVI